MNPIANNRSSTVTISRGEYNALLKAQESSLKLDKFLKYLRARNVERAKLWRDGNDERTVTELLFRSNELCGEAGEAANFVKKLARTMLHMKGGLEYNEALLSISKELADVVICVDRVAEFFDINLEEAIVQKFNETSDKHNLPTKL